MSELASSYDPLLKALEPLAGHRPDGKLLDRVPGRRANDEDRFRFVGSLVSEMRSGIGHALSAVNDDTTLVIPAHHVRTIDSTLKTA